MCKALLLACGAVWVFLQCSVTEAAVIIPATSAPTFALGRARRNSSPSVHRKLFRQRHQDGERIQPGDGGNLLENDAGTAEGETTRHTAASIVIAVTSKAPNMERRAWLRQQHANALARLRASGDPDAAAAAVMRFVLGVRGVDSAALEALTAENSTHGDLLLLPVPDADNPDPPVDERAASATTLKVAHAAEWAVRQYKAFPWFVRLGDDSYFRLDYFLRQAASDLPRSRMLLGFCKGMTLQRDVGSPPTARATVPYCSGMGFILTRDAAAFIARNLGNLNMSYPEDATVGSWFVGTNIALVHDDRFSDWEWRACSRRSIVIHKHGGRQAVDEADGSMPSCFHE